MSQKVKPRVPRGMRDMLPELMVRRQYVINVIRGVFEEFGFEPLQTPAIELDETLKGKYGSEAERLIYSTSYGRGEEKLSLRYDLSVPLCRVVAMHPDIPKPFKRYHIAPVWRADSPQKGRFREFFQCDADTVGSSSMLGDAETVAVIYTILFRLGFRDFTVNINDRKILNGIGQFSGVPETLLPGLYRSIDKISKIGHEGVKQELLAVGIPEPVILSIRRVARLYLQGKVALDNVATSLREEQIPGEDGAVMEPFPKELVEALAPVLEEILAKEAPEDVEPENVQETAGQLINGTTPVLREIYKDTIELISEGVIDKLLSLLETKGDSKVILKSMRDKLADYPEALEGIAELEDMIRYLNLLGVPERYYKIDISMVRGLEYYTGPIYETIVEKPNIGSITGGGRFDELVGMFTDRSIPATGTTVGIERIIVVMEENDMFPPSIGKTPTKVLVTAFEQELVDESIKVAAILRKAGLKTQIYFDPDPIREQIGYAATKEIPVVVILGPDEVSQKKITIRNLRTEKQATLDQDQAVGTIQEWLAQM